MKEVKIITEYIKLDSLLKYAQVVQMGSDAKNYILDGEVLVNGKTVFQRGKKIHDGDVVEVRGIATIKVVSGE